MIYLINGKYYVRLYPNRYGEIEIKLDNDNVVLVPTERRLNTTSSDKIKAIDFQKEKDNFKKELLRKEKSTEKNTNKKTRYNYFE